MKLKIMLIILVLVAVLFAINSCTTDQTTNGGKTVIEEPGKGIVKPSDPNKEGLAAVADLPLAKIISPLSVKDVIEHRSALNGKIITIKGVVVEAILGEKACPADKGENNVPPLGGCAQPRIFLADAKDTTDSNARVMILVREDENQYEVGESVKVTGSISGSKVAVVMNKIYE